MINTKGDDRMKKRVTFTLEEELLEQLKKISEETMIPQSKLIEKSLIEVLKTYENK
jgi:metal-responsive CopG/Arc/MetJ family transcriptional regulator